MSSIVRRLRHVGTMTAMIVALSLASDIAFASLQPFQIESQDAPQALLEFGRQSSLQILFATEKVRGIVTNTVHGNYEPIDALNLMLKGTGLAISTNSGGVLVVAPPDTSAEAAAEGAGSNPGLSEITVTAARKAEPLSKVPISVNAFTTEALAREGVKSIDDIAALTPGVEFDRNPSFNGVTNIAIRGVSTGEGASTTGVYFGDVPLQGRINTNSAFGNFYPVPFDLARVEVLRGPQGTLFGAGAEGGTVRYIPNEPSLTAESGFAEAEYSSTQGGEPSYEISSAYGAPITEGQLGFRAGIYYRQDGGYINRVDPIDGSLDEKNANSSTMYAVKLAMVYQANENLKITPEVYFQRQAANDNSIFTIYRSAIGASDFVDARLVRQPSEDTMALASVTAEARLAFADLTSVTSFFKRDTKAVIDNTYSAAAEGWISTNGVPGYGNPAGFAYPAVRSDASPDFEPGRLEYYSQELRLSGNDRDARLTWQGGVFASMANQSDGFIATSTHAFDTLNNVYGIVQTPQQAAEAAATIRRYGYAPNTLVYALYNIDKDKQLALFGQGDYRLTDKLKLTVGARVSRSTFNFTNIVGGLGSYGEPSIPGFESSSRTETPVTPKVALAYQADDNNMVYFSAAKGYRLGQGNIPIPTSCNFQQPFTSASDSLWSYEVGSKNRLWGGRLQIDASAFEVNWKNIQTALTLGCGYQPVINAGSAYSRGFDIATRTQVLDRLSFAFAVAYTNAKYSNSIYAQNNLIIPNGSVYGSAYSSSQLYAPWNVTGALEYTFRPLPEVDAYVRLEDVFKSRNNGPYAPADAASVLYMADIRPDPSTNMMNMRLGATFGSTTVSVFVTNVLDSQPVLGQTSLLYSSDYFVASTFRPRTLGVNAMVKF